MLRKLLLLQAFLFFCSAGLLAQTGKISGKIIDAETKESVPFANVVVNKDGVQKGGTVSDFDGNYTISPLVPGEYDIEVSYVGYAPFKITGVVVKFETTTRLDINLQSESKVLEEDVIIYAEPLIDPDNTSTGGKLNSKEIEKIPSRDVESIAMTQPGVTTSDDGAAVQLRGSRADATQYFINGVKLLPGQRPNVPVEAIAEVSILTGGIPAQYGDVVGGVISMTTKGPSSRVFGSAALETSYLLDAEQWFLGNFNVSGPIIREKDENGERTGMTKLGYFVSAQFDRVRDADLPAIDIYSLNDQTQQAIEQNPLFLNEFGNVVYAADTLRLNQLETNPYKFENHRTNVNVNATLDYQPSQNITFSIGGNYRLTDRTRFNQVGTQNARLNYLMNYDNNGNRSIQQYNIFGRFTQRFGNSTDENAKIKNAYYQIQLDYSRNTVIDRNRDFDEEFFKYNHVGKFQEEYTPFQASPFVTPGIVNDLDDNTNGAVNATTLDNGDVTYDQNVWWVDENGNQTEIQAGTPIRVVDNTSGFVTFAPSSFNPVTANYTSWTMENVQQLVATGGGFSPYGSDTLPLQFFSANSNLGFLTNGSNPNPQHLGLYQGAGTPHRNYRKDLDEQWRFSALGVADIKSHSVKVGFEFEQRIQRVFSLSSAGIWNAARTAAASANNTTESYFAVNGGSPLSTLASFDSTLGGYVIDAGSWSDVTQRGDGADPTLFEFGTRPGAAIDGTFSSTWRDRLGFGSNDPINVDALDPSQLNLSDFNAEELLRYGGTNANAVLYQGYTYDGKIDRNNSTFSDFFSDSLNRPIAAWRPNYVAFFVEDKFEIRDLIVRLGLRVDRYDVNLPTPEDKHSFVDLQRVNEVQNIGDFNGGSYTRPGSVGDDWVIYVDQDPAAGGAKDSYTVIGYRDGDTWYDAQGQEVRSARNIAAGNPIYPWFDYNSFQGQKKEIFDEYRITEDAFVDYEPQINVMPRVSFSFPISEQALFFAHYDVLVQRPSRNNVRTDEYFYWFNRGGGTISNPNLQPQRTIDYQVGFQQVLTRSSSLRLSAFYRELKDQIGIVQIEGGYPIEQFRTFENIDYATSKGLTIEYDLRRTNRLSLLGSYQLAFADGTSSGETSNQNLLQLGADANLRTPIPLNWDERHQIKLTVDYRFRNNDGGKVFQNSGVNFVLIGTSGRPYTPTGGPKLYSITDPRTEPIDGSINSGRLPWNIRTSMRIDKTFFLGNPDAGSRKTLNVYVYVQNLLNVDNIQSVYRWTGSPENDGYLASQAGQQFVSLQPYPQSYAEMYSIAVQSPDNFGLPRRIRIGASLNF